MISTACAIAAVFAGSEAAPRQSVFPQTTPYVYMLRWIYTLAPGPGESGTAPAIRPFPKRDSPGALPFSDPAARGLGYRAAWGMLSWGRDLRQPSWTTNGQRIVQALADSRALQTEPDPEQADRGALYAVRILRDFPGIAPEPALKSDLAGWLGTAVERRGSSPSVHRVLRAWSLEDQRLEKVVAGLPEPSGGDVLEEGALHLDLWERGEVRLNTALLREVGKWSWSLTAARSADVPTAFRAAVALGEQKAFREAGETLRDLSGLVNTQPNQENGLEFGSLGLGRMGFARNASPMRHEGFLLAEGQFATTLYEVQKQFGGIFTSRMGWTEGIDGVVLHRGQVMTLLGANPIPFNGVYTLEWVKEGQGRQTVNDPLYLPAIRRLEMVRRGSRLYVSAVPTFIASGPKQMFLAGTFTINGRRVPAALGPAGFEAELPATRGKSWDVAFQGKAGNDNLSTPRESLWRITPPLDRWSKTGMAGTHLGRLTINGQGSLTSPAFYLEDGLIRFEGDLPKGASVRLLRGYEPEIIAEAVGQDQGKTWTINARGYRGEVVRIQVASALPNAKVALRLR